MTTALILRPFDAPRIRILECDGPVTFARVNHSPRSHQPTLTFEDFIALPEVDKQVFEDPDSQDWRIARRLYGLLTSIRPADFEAMGKLTEATSRLRILFPHIDDA